MITADAFIAEATRRGFDFYTGVPCSFLTPLINGLLSDRDLAYVGAASEGEAMAIAAGAWLAGRQTVVMCQNSGLGNAVNPLTSLNAPFRIPTLFVTTWRGQPGIPDEPQHEVMGRITQQLLSLIGVEHTRFPNTDDLIAPALAQALDHMARTSLPFGFVMEKGDVREVELAWERPLLDTRGATHIQMNESASRRPSRAAILEKFLQLTDDNTAVIATTGKCGRELFTLADRPQHLYQVGSMGGASGMALGVALNTQKTVVVLDGDGAALMKLGTFATIGAYAPNNILHILLDNGMHDSTGGQPTVSSTVNFERVALACGYCFATGVSSSETFEAALQMLKDRKAEGLPTGPAFIHVKIAPGSMEKLGRPTVSPDQVARRFKDFLASQTTKPAMPLAS